jgi:excisionase family DNA binding protein
MPQTKTPDRRAKPPRKAHPTATPLVGADVLTLEEAAAYLRVSPKEVDDLATRHDLPARKIGDQWRFHKAALVDWLCRSSPKERLMRHAGAAHDDPYGDEMLRTIYQNRGRPMTEDES